MPEMASPPRRYRLLVVALSPLLLGYTLWRACKDGGMRYFKERLGFYADEIARSNKAAQAVTPRTQSMQRAQLWVHAASVGEVITVLPLLKAWIDNNQGVRVLVTTGTPTGAAVLQQENLSNVQHQYLPLDFAMSCKRFVAQMQAQRAWIVETEIWPWLYAHCERQQIDLTIINGRLSDKTSTQSTGLLASSYRGALRHVHVLARSAKDLQRFVALGAEHNNCQVAGNLKYGAHDTVDNPARLLDMPYVLAASTHNDEELQIALAWQSQSLSKALLVIAPRHPERGGDIKKQLNARGIDVVQRSNGETPVDHTVVYLADTLGEMQAWYKHALAAFIGGSLITRGGHNMLEPARHACPAIVGPHTGNFDDMMELLTSTNAIAVAADEYEVVSFLGKAASDDAEIKAMGKRAQRTAIDAQGTLAHYLGLLT